MIRPLCLMLSFALLTTGCTHEEWAPVNMASYNAGLADEFVDFTDARAPVIASELVNQNIQLWCMQEVWGEHHVAAMRQATDEVLPTAITLPAAQETIPGECDAEGLEPLSTCVRDACSDPPDADCILESCTDEFYAQQGDCGLCLASNVGGSIDEITEACTTETGRYQQHGSYGLMMLTSSEVLEQDHLELDASLNRRAVMYAKLAGDVHVFCTHLTAVEPIPYPLAEGSWDEEQQGQIDALIDYIEDKSEGGTAVLLGDLNVGPDEQPERYDDLLTATGMINPYRGGCTFCADNPLTPDGASSARIDHVLVRGTDANKGRRFMDAAVLIGESSTTLSDHYGVTAMVMR